jgi:hypothetical protein
MSGRLTVILLGALRYVSTQIGSVRSQEAASAVALREKYLSLQPQLTNNQFQRPLYLNSSEAPGKLAGDIYAVIGSPFDATAAALSAPIDWCEILLLHINTKTCTVSPGTAGKAGSVLSMWVGTKRDQPLSEAYRVDFTYRIGARDANYLLVELNAKEGPMGTRDYRVMLETTPLDNGRTFMHLSYSYGYGTMGKLAMQTYLATVGRSKVGFTIVGTEPNGQPRHVGGLRGVVERNTMRYYLAIEAHMGALSAPPQARFEKSIRDWYAAAERYPRQLHELEEGEYLAMKRKEKQRQQSGAV